MTAARLSIRVVPGSSRAGVGGQHGDALVVRVGAPAVEGQANRAACRLLAKALGVAPTRLTILQGEHGRDKLIAVEGIEQPELDSRVAALTRAVR